MNVESIKGKYQKLLDIITSYGEVIVAYSGGVDSTFLLKAAVHALGHKASGVLALSPSYPSREYGQAIENARLMGARLDIIQSHETEDENFLKNPVNRCYFCKSDLYKCIADFAGRQTVQVLDGSNADDMNDYRPGLKAVKEKGVKSPLQEAGLTKLEIRELSKQHGLNTWDKDALACLSSRFPYGEPIDPQKLKMVDEMETALFNLGFNDIRARHAKNAVKIEVRADQVKRLFDDDIREFLVQKAKEIGYKNISVDLEGYTQGKLNSAIQNTKNKLDTKELMPMKIR
jgi:pyridinium-3,5-biscarboxylic acid mononucleotide sulfurtransferase